MSTYGCRNCGASPTNAVIGSDNDIEERVIRYDGPDHYATDDSDPRDYAPPVYARCLDCGEEAGGIHELMSAREDR
jgi:hypothetical protein